MGISPVSSAGESGLLPDGSGSEGRGPSPAVEHAAAETPSVVMDEISLSEAALALRAVDADAPELFRITSDAPAPPYLRSGTLAPLFKWESRSRRGWLG